jgi:ribonucleoside-diphosphate reductase alpha chain
MTTALNANLNMDDAIVVDSPILRLSLELENLKAERQAPTWYTVEGYQMLVEKDYLYNGETPRGMYKRIARTAARHTDQAKYYERHFFKLMWKGWLSPATPVLSNMGTDRGCPVSCSGGVVHDSILGMYDSRRETAVLTKSGFGTSAYLGDIRAEGSPIRGGGKAQGVMQPLKMFVRDMQDVSQGNTRRGAWAGYLELEHDDFFEVAQYLLNNPDDLNIGWVWTDAFRSRLNAGDADAIARFQRMMHVRRITGKGYIFKRDTVNRLNPAMYKDLGLNVKASNLCSEIMLFSDEDHTFTCVLSSLNLVHWDEIKKTNAVQLATIFLDCVVEEFLSIARTMPGMEKAVRFTEKSRAIGLGVLGFHTYLQNRNIAIEDMEAHMLNNRMFANIKSEAMAASQWMAKEWGEPEWCKGYGQRNTHLLAVAPTMSTALVCGGVSQGIEPIVANVYNQSTAAGEMFRCNPRVIELMHERGVYSPELVREVMHNNGSVQDQTSWLTDEERRALKTAYEVPQDALIRLAAGRQRHICQGQSLNLFFDANEDEGYIAMIHQQALTNEWIKAVYYQRGLAGIKASKGECSACEG